VAAWEDNCLWFIVRSQCTIEMPKRMNLTKFLYNASEPRSLTIWSKELLFTAQAYYSYSTKKWPNKAVEVLWHQQCAQKWVIGVIWTRTSRIEPAQEWRRNVISWLCAAERDHNWSNSKRMKVMYNEIEDFSYLWQRIEDSCNNCCISSNLWVQKTITSRCGPLLPWNEEISDIDLVVVSEALLLTY
jgi:hypothetical protein